jgi:hypothetical protein
MHKKAAIWGAAALLAVVVLVLLIRGRLQRRSASVEGAVLMQDTDPRRQLPISGVEVSTAAGETMVQSRSDAAGFFRLKVPLSLWRNETSGLDFRHPGYRSVHVSQQLGEQIYVVRMAAIASQSAPEPTGAQATLKDVRVRYATKATTPINVGSIAKTFEVANAGDVPCNHAPVCSPNGKWKASLGGLSLRKNRFGPVFRRRPRYQGGGAELVRHGDVSGGGGGDANDTQRRDSQCLSDHLRARNEFYSPSGGGRAQHRD